MLLKGLSPALQLRRLAAGRDRSPKAPVFHFVCDPAPLAGGQFARAWEVVALHDFISEPQPNVEDFRDLADAQQVWSRPCRSRDVAGARLATRWHPGHGRAPIPPPIEDLLPYAVFRRIDRDIAAPVGRPREAADAEVRGSVLRKLTASSAILGSQSAHFAWRRRSGGPVSAATDFKLLRLTKISCREPAEVRPDTRYVLLAITGASPTLGRIALKRTKLSLPGSACLQVVGSTSYTRCPTCADGAMRRPLWLPSRNGCWTAAVGTAASTATSRTRPRTASTGALAIGPCATSTSTPSRTRDSTLTATSCRKARAPSCAIADAICAHKRFWPMGLRSNSRRGVASFGASLHISCVAS